MEKERDRIVKGVRKDVIVQRPVNIQRERHCRSKGGYGSSPMRDDEKTNCRDSTEAVVTMRG